MTRLVVALLTLTLLAAPRAAGAQPAGKVYRVALIFTASPVSEMAGPNPSHPGVRVFLHTLRALGYVEGQNLIFEPRSAEGKLERVPEIVAELVRLRTDVIVTTGDEVTQHVFQITKTVPIVTWGGRNLVELGLVQSLARPGGNVTGFAVTPDPEIEAKRLQLLKEVVPQISRVAFLGTKQDWESRIGSSVRAAAQKLDMTLRLGELTSGRDAHALEPESSANGRMPYLLRTTRRILAISASSSISRPRAGYLPRIHGENWWRTAA